MSTFRSPLHDRWSAASDAVKGKYFEYVIQALIDALCSPGDCAIDVGANWGSHTHVMLEAVGPAGQVIAFEPNPALAGHLREWRKRSPALTVIQTALSDHDGTATFFRAEDSGYSTLNAEVSARTTVAETLGVTLRRMDGVAEVAAAEPAFIKIDVEGEELRVLFGAERTIRRTRPVIVAEIDWKFLFHGERKPSEQVLFDWMARAVPGGYRMFNLFGEPVTGFDWDAWNVVMLPHGHPGLDAVPGTIAQAGARFFEEAGDWDPMKRHRQASGGAAKVEQAGPALPSGVTALPVSEGPGRFLLHVPAEMILARQQARLGEIARNLGEAAEGVRERFGRGVLSEVLEAAIDEALKGIGAGRITVEETTLSETDGLRCRLCHAAADPLAAPAAAGSGGAEKWVTLPPSEPARAGDVAECAVEGWMETKGPVEGAPDLLGAEEALAGAAPGALPVGWWHMVPEGIHWSLMGSGRDFGVPFIEIRCHGTAPAETQITLRFAEARLLWSEARRLWLEVPWRLLSGSVPESCAPLLVLGRHGADGSYLETQTLQVKAPDARPLIGQRPTAAFDMPDPAGLEPGIAFWFKQAAAVDWRLRVGLPSLRLAEVQRLPWPEMQDARRRVMVGDPRSADPVAHALAGLHAGESRVVDQAPAAAPGPGDHGYRPRLRVTMERLFRRVPR